MKPFPRFSSTSFLTKKLLASLATFVLALAAFGLGIGAVYATVTLTTNSITSDTGLTITTSDGEDLRLHPAGDIDAGGNAIKNADFGQLVQDLLRQDQWVVLQGFGGISGGFTTGSGLNSEQFRSVFVDTGETASSTAYRRPAVGAEDNGAGWSTGVDGKRVDWSKPLVVQWTLSHLEGTANGVTRLTWGKNAEDGMGALANAGVGIQIDDTALKGVAHDGASPNTVDLNTNLSAGIVYRITIVSDGTGNVEWFVNDTSAGTSTGGPSAVGDVGDEILQIEVDNGVDASRQATRLHSTGIYITQ
jgi:hypothetical protein